MMPMQPTLPGFALLLVLHASGNRAKSQVARKGASTTLPAANSWMPGLERSHLLRCCYQENCPKQDESGGGIQWNICGQSVCFQRFCEVLGSSQRTIRRMTAGQPDLRTAVGGKQQPRLALQTLKCDHFFRNLDASAAEPMPEKPRCTPKLVYLEYLVYLESLLAL